MHAIFFCLVVGVVVVSGGTGYFHVKQDASSGRWWMYDPDGKAFYHRGITSVNRGGLAEGLIGPYNETVAAKYSSDEAFVKTTWSRLRQWGLNALGAWCTPDFWSHDGKDWPEVMPYAIDLEFSRPKPTNVLQHTPPMPPWLQVKMDMDKLEGPADVYDPRWEAFINARAKEILKSQGQEKSKSLIGYFTDNEIGWGEYNTPEKHVYPSNQPNATVRPSLLQHCLSAASNQSAYIQAWSFVLSRYTTVSALGTAWGYPLSTKGDVANLTRSKLSLVSAQYQKDDAEWTFQFVDRYFSLSKAAIRSYDANHMYIGIRAASPPGNATMTAMGRHLDIVSMNNYRYNYKQRIQYFAEGTRRPILGTEFNWVGSGMSCDPSVPYGKGPLCCPTPTTPPAKGGFVCAVPGEPTKGSSPLWDALNFTTHERLYCNGGYALQDAITHPSFVGYTYYRFVSPPTVPSLQWGAIDDKDRPTYNLQVLRTVNARAENIHTAGQMPPLQGYPHGMLCDEW